MTNAKPAAETPPTSEAPPAESYAFLKVIPAMTTSAETFVRLSGEINTLIAGRTVSSASASTRLSYDEMAANRKFTDQLRDLQTRRGRATDALKIATYGANPEIIGGAPFRATGGKKASNSPPNYTADFEKFIQARATALGITGIMEIPELRMEKIGNEGTGAVRR